MSGVEVWHCGNEHADKPCTPDAPCSGGLCAPSPSIPPEPVTPSPEREGCTGLTASWCPIHGDCTCIRSHEDPRFQADKSADTYDGADIHLNADDCPLHASSSEHPAAASPDRLRERGAPPVEDDHASTCITIKPDRWESDDADPESWPWLANVYGFDGGGFEWELITPEGKSLYSNRSTDDPTPYLQMAVDALFPPPAAASGSGEGQR